MKCSRWKGPLTSPSLALKSSSGTCSVLSLSYIFFIFFAYGICIEGLIILSRTEKKISYFFDVVSSLINILVIAYVLPDRAGPARFRRSYQCIKVKKKWSKSQEVVKIIKNSLFFLSFLYTTYLFSVILECQPEQKYGSHPFEPAYWDCKYIFVLLSARPLQCPRIRAPRPGLRSHSALRALGESLLRPHHPRGRVVSKFGLPARVAAGRSPHSPLEPSLGARRTSRGIPVSTPPIWRDA